MKYLKILFIVMVTSSLISCATIPTPVALNDQSSGIGIAVYFKQFIGGQRPQNVYFVKLDEGADENALLRKTNVIRSNFSTDNYIYLLNAEPGLYAAVAAYHVQRSNYSSAGSGSGGASIETTTNYYFPKEMIKAAEVKVIPGQMAFMGEYEMKSERLTDPDNVQEHFYKVIEPEKGGKIKSFGSEVMGSLISSLFTGKMKASQQSKVIASSRDKNAEVRFLKAAGNDLEKGGWSDGIQTQYLELFVGKPGSSFQSNPQ